MLFALLLAAAPARAAELALAASSTVQFVNHTSLGDFTGSGAPVGRFDPSTGRGALDLDAASLTTGNGPRDARLRAYCLDAAQFPRIHYAVTSVTGDAAGLKAAAAGTSGTVTLNGALTIRDVTLPVSAPASYAWTAAGLQLRGQVDLRWADYGVPDPGVVIATLEPDMSVRFDVLAASPAAAQPSAASPAPAPASP